jgi:hypothetical protein
MAGVPITVWDLLGESARLAGTRAAAVAAAFAVLAGAYAANSIFPLGEIAGFSLGGVVLWILILLCQFTLTRLLLADLDLIRTEPERSSFWPMMGLLLLSQLGIVAGLGLFVVPGLIFWVRWLLAGPILVAEGRGVFDSFGKSWAETSANAWLIFQALALVFAPFLLLAVVNFLAESPEDGRTALSHIGNVFAYAGAVAGWIVAVAAYGMSGRGRRKADR